ncbi:MAG: hydrogenase maturation protease [Anaerolineae bacterium]|nr:hydrogenase maturation protease [Anaerolineae bacterium]
MTRTLVIGYGNPVRRDDGLGWLVANQLGRIINDPTVEIVTTIQLLPEHLALISETDRVIFVDACEDGRPGEWHFRPIQASKSQDSALTHHFSPEQLLAMADLLYAHSPDAAILTVSGADFGYGEGLSACVEAVLPEIIDLLCQHCTTNNPEQL